MADTLVDATVDAALNARVIRAGPVWLDKDIGYVAYIDSNANLVYQKTTNGGTTWGGPVVVHAGTTIKSSLWYDKWTPGDTGAILHFAYIDSATNLIRYRSLDTATSILSDEVTVFTGVSLSGDTWTAAVVDITKSRSGNLYVAFWGDSSIGGLLIEGVSSSLEGSTLEVSHIDVVVLLIDKDSYLSGLVYISQDIRFLHYVTSASNVVNLEVRSGRNECVPDC